MGWPDRKSLAGGDACGQDLSMIQHTSRTVGDGDLALHLGLYSDSGYRFLRLSGEADNEPGEITIELDEVDALVRALLELKTLGEA
jgi:hypothetical protein